MFECLNCGAAYETENDFIPLTETESLGWRVDPGSVVPWGQCPSCKALVYAVEAPSKKYTVILAYPLRAWSTDLPETYIEWTEAESIEEAIKNVQKMAQEANDGDYSCDEFKLIAVYKGHIDTEN